MQPSEHTQQFASLGSKAVTAALVFDAVDAPTRQHDISSFALRAKIHLEAVGESDMAENVSDAMKLAKLVAKVSALLWQLLCHECL